jgi:hypothetical protein
MSLVLNIRGKVAICVQKFKDGSEINQALKSGEIVIEEAIIPFILQEGGHGDIAQICADQPLWIGINYFGAGALSDQVFEIISIISKPFMGSIYIEKENLKVFIATFCMAALQ